MKRLALILLVFFIFRGSAIAAEEYEISGEEVYNSAVADIAKGRLSLNPIDIINSLISQVFSELSEAKSVLKSVLLIAAASGVLKVLSDSFGNGDTASAAFFACFLLITASVLRFFFELASYGTEIIHTMCDFITKFEPIFIALLASSGAIAQAAAFEPVLTAGVYVLTLLVDNCILPLVWFSAVLGIVNSIGGRIEVGNLNKLIKSVSKWLLTGILTLFSAILTLYGFGTSAFNNLTAKGIKFAVGSFVPVVGGILSDTIDTVLSGAGLLKNAVGTAGMIAIIAMAAVPVVKMWVMMMVLRLSAAAIEPFSDKRITSVLVSAADASATVFSMVITSVMLFIISIGIILAATGVSL